MRLRKAQLHHSSPRGALPPRQVSWPQHFSFPTTDGEAYAYDTRAVVLVYALRSGEQLHALAHPSPPLAMAFVSSGLLLTGDAAGALPRNETTLAEALKVAYQ